MLKLVLQSKFRNYIFKPIEFSLTLHKVCSKMVSKSLSLAGKKTRMNICRVISNSVEGVINLVGSTFSIHIKEPVNAMKEFKGMLMVSIALFLDLNTSFTIKTPPRSTQYPARVLEEEKAQARNTQPVGDFLGSSLLTWDEDFE